MISLTRMFVFMPKYVILMKRLESYRKEMFNNVNNLLNPNSQLLKINYCAPNATRKLFQTKTYILFKYFQGKLKFIPNVNIYFECCV